jgi:hypothetical protein
MKRDFMCMALVAVILFAVAGCGELPTSPSSVTVVGGRTPVGRVGVQQAAPLEVAEGTLVSVSGIVSSASGSPLSGATVTIVDGRNAGRTATTDATGEYRFADVQASNGNVVARATGYQELQQEISLDGTAPVNFTLQGPNFTGTWNGVVISTNCFAEGIFDKFCGLVPKLGLTMKLVLNQVGTAVTGSIELLEVPRIAISGNVQGDRLVLTARGEFVSGPTGVQMSYEDWNTLLTGANLAGTFSWRLFATATGVPGGAKWTFTLNDVALAAVPIPLPPAAPAPVPAPTPAAP